MPLISRTVRVSISLPNEEKATFICRRPTSAELSAFLNSRFTNVRNKLKTRLYEARAEFFDKIAVNAENVTFENANGTAVPLNASTSLTDEDKAAWSAILGTPVTSWKDLIDVSWKSSVSMRFEDPAADFDGDEAEDPAKN
jgi:hypothetical protein